MNQLAMNSLAMHAPMGRHGAGLRMLKSTALASCVALLCACGGSNSSNHSESDNDSNHVATTSNAISGTVSGLGSVVVNGVRYETVGASVLDVDDGSIIETRLGLGMPVSVMPLTSSASTAGTIYVQTGLKGPSSALSLDSAGNAGSVWVAGLPVQFDASTFVYSDATGLVGSLSDLANAQNLEVYGVPQADGSFQATRIEIKATGQTIKLVGTVANLDTSKRSFTLGNATHSVTVSYTGDPLGLANGAVVSVRTLAVASANSYTASSVRVRSSDVSTFTQYIDNTRGTSAVSNERNELYGMVTQLISNASGDCSMQVQGVPTILTSTALCAAIQNGDYVEVKGLFTNGTLNAYRVEFKTAGTDRALSAYQDHELEDGSLKYRRLWNVASNAPNTASNTSTDSSNTSNSSSSAASTSFSSGSYELYGTLNCVTNACTLSSNGMTMTADLSTAFWKNGAVSSGVVEAKGYVSAANTFKVLTIESKNRYNSAGSDASSSSGDSAGGYIELKGTLSNCSTTTCNLVAGNGANWTVDVSSTFWEHGRISSGWVEAKGIITAANAFKASKVEAKY